LEKYAPNVGAPNSIKETLETLLDVKAQIDPSAIVEGDLTPNSH
jgi:hypothetical protein